MASSPPHTAEAARTVMACQGMRVMVVVLRPSRFLRVRLVRMGPVCDSWICAVMSQGGMWMRTSLPPVCSMTA